MNWVARALLVKFGNAFIEAGGLRAYSIALSEVREACSTVLLEVHIAKLVGGSGSCGGGSTEGLPYNSRG